MPLPHAVEIHYTHYECKFDPVLLDSVILPTPIKSLRFRTSLDTVTWSEPEHFHPDDEGYINLKRSIP